MCFCLIMLSTLVNCDLALNIKICGLFQSKKETNYHILQFLANYYIIIEIKKYRRISLINLPNKSCVPHFKNIIQHFIIAISVS